MDSKSEARSQSRPPLRICGYPGNAPEPLHLFRSDAPLKADPNFKAAKAGDTRAAIAVVRALVTPDFVENARRQFGEGVTFLPVHAMEASGMNKIPVALAGMLASLTNGTIASGGMIQSNKSGHTGADAMERLVSRVTFDGDVTVGARYVLVDDVTTMGGTLAELSDYVVAEGGEVAGAAVLVDASRPARLKPELRVVKELERRFADAIRGEFNIEPSALTASEAAYLINFKDEAQLRKRAATARIENARRANLRRGE